MLTVIAAALTYTAVVAVAMLLSAGGAPGGRGRHRIGRTAGRPRFPLVRMAVALAIMLAPQPGVGVFALIFSVGHIGTAAPVMLAWALMADPLVLVVAVGPVLVRGLPPHLPRASDLGCLRDRPPVLPP